MKLLRDSALAAAFRYCDEAEEACQGCMSQSAGLHMTHSWKSSTAYRTAPSKIDPWPLSSSCSNSHPLPTTQWESMAQKAEPLMLHRRPQEAIRHEPRQALEIEGRRAAFRRRYHEVVLGPRHLPIELVDGDREEILVAVDLGIEFGLSSTQPERCEGLCDRVCYSTKYLRRLSVSIAAR